jgi:hypothetical protein
VEELIEWGQSARMIRLKNPHFRTRFWCFLLENHFRPTSSAPGGNRCAASTGNICLSSAALGQAARPVSRVRSPRRGKRSAGRSSLAAERGANGRCEAGPAHCQGCLRLAWLNRSARFRSQGSDRHRHTVRRCMDPARPVGAVWAAGRARHRDVEESSLPHAGRQRRQ